MIPTTSLRIIMIVVLAIATDVTVGLGALSYCLIAGVHADSTLLTAYVGMTGSLIGALTGMLVNTRTATTTNGNGNRSGYSGYSG